jgi:hypothetical protein
MGRALRLIAAPPGWSVTETRLDGSAFRGRLGGRRFFVIVSDALEADGNRWRHVSVSAGSGPLPTWGELEVIRTLFIGDRFAYQVHAPAAEHVNLHPGVLHLWARHGDDAGRALPDFTRGSGSI